jgi:hypothetical protein
MNRITPTRWSLALKTPAALLGLAFAFVLAGGDAHAGIIVTVGKPNPELCDGSKSSRSTGSATRRLYFESEGTRCVELPGGQVECGKAIRVDTTSALPRDWRCVAVAPGVLYCEIPTPATAQGAGPAAAGGGEFDPSRFEVSNGGPGPELQTLDRDQELLAVGCGQGASSSGLVLLAALGMLAWFTARRRRSC